MKTIALFCLVFLYTIRVYPLDRDCCEHRYCPEHVFAEGTYREEDNCSAEELERARPYLALIPRPYLSTELCCGDCGQLLEDDGYGMVSYWEELDPVVLHWVIKEGPACFEPEYFWCRNQCDDEIDPIGCEKAWDAGYFKRSNRKYYPFFLEHLKYCSQNPTCQNLWPELGGLAAQINDLAYQAFESVVKSEVLGDRFDPDAITCNFHGKTCSLIIYLYFYSQYHHVFSDVIQWIDGNSWHANDAQIQIDHLYQAMDQIQPLFLDLYSTCIADHPHPKLFYERGLVHFHRGDTIEAGEDIQQCLSWAEANGLDDVLLSELYHHQGELYLNARAYDEAVSYISRAIMKNPDRREYYLDRASAYLELGEFDFALADFYASGFQPSWAPEKSIAGDLLAAAPAFASGVGDGLKDWSGELIPALTTTAHGIGKALWAMTPFPGSETYRAEIIETVSGIVDYARENCDHGGLALIPEMRDLLQAQPGQLTNEQIGYKVGYMVGKYGAEILSAVGIAKVAKHCQTLRRINTAATLQAYASSPEAAEAVATRTSQHAAKRAETLKKASYRLDPDKQGKHSVGHHFYRDGNSIFEGDPVAFVERYRGKGIPSGNKVPGTAGYRETVDAGEIVGLCYDLKSRQYVPTTRATIHYAQNGCHVVPSPP